MAFPAPHAPLSLPLPDPEAYPGEPREYARALVQRKDEIEKEIDALKDVLSSHGVTQDTPLVDPEGYPRGDIDVYAITHARSALTRLYNDRAEVTRRLAPALDAAFSADAAQSQSGPTTASTSAPSPQSTTTERATSTPSLNGHREPALDVPDAWPERPVARVNSVAPSSPAASAGLQRDDMIYSFSGITAEQGMAAIGPVVARSEGLPLTLLITRGGERRMLRLTPRSGWGGRGLLGCHILPV